MTNSFSMPMLTKARRSGAEKESGVPVIHV